MAIRCVLMDVDGVLTDGVITYTSDGKELKNFHVADGMGLTVLRTQGIKTGIITGRTSSIVERRANELHMDVVQMGVRNKSEALLTICKTFHWQVAEVAYIGDDLNDLGALQLAGLAIAPANACVEVRNVADFVTTRCGGSGAVREAAEYIIKQNGSWQDVVALYERELYEMGQ